MGMGAFCEFLFLFNLDISISFLNRRFSKGFKILEFFVLAR